MLRPPAVGHWIWCILLNRRAAFFLTFARYHCLTRGRNRESVMRDAFRVRGSHAARQQRVVSGRSPRPIGVAELRRMRTLAEDSGL
jgi:hypothetical protein